MQKISFEIDENDIPSLIQKINDLIEFSLQGRQERELIFDKFINSLQSIFKKNQKCFLEIDFDQNLQILILIVRLFRNLCVQNDKIQNDLIKTELVEDCLLLINKIFTNKQEFKKEEFDFLNSSLQFFVNLMNENQKNTQLFLEKYYSSLFETLVKINEPNTTMMKSILILIYNLLRRNEKGKIFFLTNQKCLKLFSKIFSKYVDENDRQKDDNILKQIGEWISIICNWIFKSNQDSLKTIFTLFSDYPKRIESLKNEQLEIINIFLENSEDEKFAKESIFSSSEDNIFNLKNCQFLIHLYTETISLISNSKKELQKEGGILEVFTPSLYNILRIILNVFLNFTCHPLSWEIASKEISSFDSFTFCSLYLLQHITSTTPSSFNTPKMVFSIFFFF